MTRQSLLAIAAGVLTAAVALVIKPQEPGISVIVTAAVHAMVWPMLQGRGRPNARAIFAGLACGLATGLVLARLPASFLASDRFAGGASVGLAAIVLPACAIVAALAALGVQAISEAR